jgi:hypothetical protein
MNLITAHRILIGSAIALFLFYGSLEFQQYAEKGGISQLAQGCLSFAAAVGFGVYLRTVKRR